MGVFDSYLLVVPGAAAVDAAAAVDLHRGGALAGGDAAGDGGVEAELAAAASLGLRVDRFLAAVAAGDSEEPVQLWGELHTALTAWTAAHGNPHAHRPLLRLVKTGHTGAERFLATFERGQKTLIEGLRSKYSTMRTVVYGYVQDADVSKKVVQAQILKIELTDKNGNILATQTAQ